MKKTAFGLAMAGFMSGASPMAFADAQTHVVTPIPPADQAKIACLAGYEPVITNLERLQRNFAPGTEQVVTNVRSQGPHFWFVEVGVVGDDGQVSRATEHGPHVIAEAECRPVGDTMAEAEGDPQN